ncbi:MAG: MarR family transcriptional regulator, partial [Candidatus Odinarchaeota archaeon]
MTVEEEIENYNHLFSDKLRKYEDKLVEILLNIAQSKRANPKISRLSSYLLIHEALTQKELKKLTDLSMGSISTYLSVMTGTGVFIKERIPHTHTFKYSYLGKIEDLTIKGIELAISSIIPLENYLKNKKKQLNKLINQSKKGADHLSHRIDELIESFEIYKTLYPLIYNDIMEKIQEETYIKEFNLTKNQQTEIKKIVFDEEVYLIEDDLLNQLAGSPMFSSRDPMFIRILGYFITRKYLTQKKLQRITGLSAGKISEEVNLMAENGLVEIAYISPKGKITYGAESAGEMLLKFSKSIINR